MQTGPLKVIVCNVTEQWWFLHQLQRWSEMLGLKRCRIRIKISQIKNNGGKTFLEMDQVLLRLLQSSKTRFKQTRSKWSAVVTTVEQSGAFFGSNCNHSFMSTKDSDKYMLSNKGKNAGTLYVTSLILGKVTVAFCSSLFVLSLQLMCSVVQLCAEEFVAFCWFSFVSYLCAAQRACCLILEQFCAVLLTSPSRYPLFED